ncbi:MAG TPA: VTT domain-containing protein [Thermoanaerobaculia bacterium]|nr:VTT domain-containing protein [Thermoanaerobaculia bacterium]
MDQIVAQLIQYGLAVVFANVFLEQVGVPIPALPTLVVAGALAARGRMDLATLLAVALVASVLADTLWFLIGRWQGHRVLRTVCKLSLSPDSCVRGTEDLFERAGMPSLLYAKFIPGYNTIAPPLAGAMDKSLGSFIFWDSLGSLLWIGSGVTVGVIFHKAVGRALLYLETLGYWAGGALAVVVLLVVAVKWWQRKRVRRYLDLARISVAELKRMIAAGDAPVIVDVRNRTAPLHDPRRIPGALRMTIEEIDAKLTHLPREREIILYCT